MSIDLKNIMQIVTEEGSPDLHLQVGQPPVIRLRNGDLSSLDMPAISKEDVEAVIEEVLTSKQKESYKAKHQVDFSYSIPNLSRFRVNVFDERNGPSVAFRSISESIPTFEELGLNDTVRSLAMQPHGLVLVTGQTGMGKSTTLASIVDYINENKKSHIITIEDPIEFVYQKKQALITQRELNVHTHSFADAIKGALRQDPNVVMVGEMRDLETIAAAITLAETGHLVLSTLHTSDAAQTVDRIIDVFPPYQQQQIRAQLSVCLRGVISQVLVPRADNQGRVAAREIMLVNDAIKNCISKGETHQIYSIMQIGAGEGMVLIDNALGDLCKAGVITPEEALSKASDPEFLKTRLQALEVV
ncbi:type IV pilus twitching motility protein PilT [Patescibacteria group bacterium]|nr:type IV pilus twitching motility protein PilT [Patescibacteria group bacterium]MBU1682567.1 type IV pilus twitching motility protein PilT [Patescibacteria group bacterium]